MKTDVFVTLKDYLAADLDLVDRAQPVTGSSKSDIILPAQLWYLPYRTEKKTGPGNVAAVLRRGMD